MSDLTPTLTDEQRARDLTYAIMRHYGYTDEDIIAAEATHPGVACGDECSNEDGLSKHPIYDELASTASLMVDVVDPLVARMVADAEQRGRAEVSAAVEAVLADMATWCGPYGHQGVAEFIDRRDEHLRDTLARIGGTP